MPMDEIGHMIRLGVPGLHFQFGECPFHPRLLQIAIVVLSSRGVGRLLSVGDLSDATKDGLASVHLSLSAFDESAEAHLLIELSQVCVKHGRNFKRFLAGFGSRL